MYCYVILNNSLFHARCRALHSHPAPSRCKDTTKSFLPEIFAFTIFTVNHTFINDCHARRDPTPSGQRRATDIKQKRLYLTPDTTPHNSNLTAKNYRMMKLLFILLRISYRS